MVTDTRPLWFPLFPLPAYETGKQKKRHIPKIAIRVGEEFFMHLIFLDLAISYNVSKGHLAIQ